MAINEDKRYTAWSQRAKKKKQNRLVMDTHARILKADARTHTHRRKWNEIVGKRICGSERSKGKTTTEERERERKR